MSSENFIKLAPQFRCPSGYIGIEVGQRMNKMNASQNDWVLSLLNLQPSDNILEIGFGTGQTLKKVTKIVNRGKIYGIDLSSTMFEEASETLKKEINNKLVRLCVGSAESLPYPENKFDKVYAVHVVYFWDDLIKVFSEVYRVLSPSGLLVLSFVSPIIAPNPFFHEYKDSGIIEKLLSTGFTNIKVKNLIIGKQNGVCILAKK